MFAGKTLGWGVLAHAHRHLPSPADASRPFVLTDEQAEFILRLYAVDDTGERLYRRAELEMPKGWGKSPLAALVAVEEFCGPVLFDHWGADGQPVGRPWDNPWVQVAAVSEDQTENTYAAIFEMLSANDGRAAKSLGIDNGRTRLYLHGRPGRLEPVTASAGSREGQRLTFAVLDETHLWTRRNGGVKLAGTIRRNAAKMGGSTLETTNAPLLGEKSVAEQSGTAPGVLHYARRPSRPPEPTWTDDELRAALDEVYGGSYWIDRDRLVREIRDPATSWDDATRFYFNVRSAGQGRAVDPRRWEELRRPDLNPPPGAYVALGFDGSISDDATVLRGCTPGGHSFIVGSWVRPRDAAPEWRVPRSDVDEAVRRAFSTYKVGRMYADPPKWWSEIEAWGADFRDPDGKPAVLAYDTNSAQRIGPAVDRWLTMVREGTHTHDGDPVTTEHVVAAHLEKLRDAASDADGRTLYRLVKGDDRRKIDAAVADVLALQAAMTMPPEPGPAPVPNVYIPGLKTDDAPREGLTPEEEQAELERAVAERHFFGDDDW